MRGQGLITTADELAEVVINDPTRVAGCMSRISRLGGQVPHCSALYHSLAVYEEVALQTSDLVTLLWALIRDVHQVVIGNIAFVQHVNSIIQMDQEVVHAALRRRIPALPEYNSNADALVWDVCRTITGREIDRVNRGERPYPEISRRVNVVAWSEKVTELIRRVQSIQQAKPSEAPAETLLAAGENGG